MFRSLTTAEAAWLIGRFGTRGSSDGERGRDHLLSGPLELLAKLAEPNVFMVRSFGINGVQQYHRARRLHEPVSNNQAQALSDKRPVDARRTLPFGEAAQHHWITDKGKDALSRGEPASR